MRSHRWPGQEGDRKTDAVPVYSHYYIPSSGPYMSLLRAASPVVCTHSFPVTLGVLSLTESFTTSPCCSGSCLHHYYPKLRLTLEAIFLHQVRASQEGFNLDSVLVLHCRDSKQIVNENPRELSRKIFPAKFCLNLKSKHWI